MNPFFSFLLGTIERKVVTAVVLVVGIATFVVPQVNNLKVSINENFAAQTDEDYCHNTYQVRASKCNADSRCNWTDSCHAKSGGGGGGGNSPVTATAQCSNGQSGALISWPTKDNTDYWIDLGTNSAFGGGSYSSKNTSKGSSNTTAPNGFNKPLTLNPGTTYYVRVYYPSTGERTSPASFTAQKCGGGGGGTPTPIPTSTVNPSGGVQVSVDLKVNGKDGPFVATGQTVNVAWTSKNAVSCDKTINERYYKASAEIKHSVPLQNSAGDAERLLSGDATASVVIVCTGLDGKVAIDSIDFGESGEVRRGYGRVERIDPDGTVTGFARIGLGDAPFTAMIICDSPDINTIGGRQGTQVSLDRPRPDLGSNFRGFTAKIPDKCRDGNKHLLDIIARGSQRQALDWFVTASLRFSVPSR